MLPRPSMTSMPAWMVTSLPPSRRLIKLIKLHLKCLDCTNAANYSLSDCRTTISTNLTCTSIIAGLCKKLKDSMDGINELWKRVSIDYREAMEWWYYKVTKEKPDKEMVEALVAMGEGERFMQRSWWYR
ncbi:putative Syntaxin-123 [Cocos nucifera]|nr:putative Syntaxin-123 [Cocos nucifera]